MSDFFATPWTVVCQASLFLGFSKQEYWSGLPFPSPGDLLYLGIKPVSPLLAGRFFTTEPLGTYKGGRGGNSGCIFLMQQMYAFEKGGIYTAHLLKLSFKDLFKI